MKSFILVATSVFIAIQLTCAAPAPEDEKKEAALAVSPTGVVGASPRAAEATQEDIVVTTLVEDSSPRVLKDVPKGPAEAPAKAQ